MPVGQSDLDPDLAAALLAFARDLPELTPEEREARLLDAFDGDEKEAARFLDRLSGTSEE